MNEEELNNIKEQHINNYRNAIIENIRNNTSVLVNEDLTSLLKKPPLDSMDLIKTKFLSLAKKNKLVLNIDELNRMLNCYRKFMLKCCDEINNIRVTELTDKVEKIDFTKNSDVIKINKKDFMNVNKEIKKILKEQLAVGYE